MDKEKSGIANESESNVKSSSERSKMKENKIKIKKIDDLRTYTHECLLTYCNNLHSLVRKKDKKLKKCKQKLKNLKRKFTELECAAKDEKSMKSAKDEKVNNHNITKIETKDPEEPLSFADEIRQAAEDAQNQNGFIFEPTSGLYYDQKTGYYYNAECGLYYDGNTGCYYEYDQEKNEFRFHSQVMSSKTKEWEEARENDIFDNYVNRKLLDKFSDLKIDQMRESALGKNCGRNNMDDDEEDGIAEEWGVNVERRRKEPKSKRSDRKRKHESKKRRRSLKKSSESPSDGKQNEREDGEVMSSPASTLSEDEKPLSKCHYRDIAKKYPPSLRIIVQETNLDKLKVGTLRLITFKGGTLGREGSHDVIIPDVNVSKFHLNFAYDTKQGVYKCTDLGSRNGTILNGTRMSNAMQESEPFDLVHGSIIQVSQTKLLCHIHAGNSTCGQCEPGLLTAATPVAITNVASSLLTHKQQLKKIQKKYGLENEKYIETKQISFGYNDRAATRRIEIGSSNDNEKTQIASVNSEIASNNKGFKMLTKLGWNKGETLGKTHSVGLLEPININANEGKKGFGCDDQLPSNIIQMTKAQKHKMSIMKKTQDRYSKQPDIFQVSDENGNSD